MNIIKFNGALELPKFSSLPSPIHGKGLFADSPIKRDVLICTETLRIIVGSQIQFDGPLRWVNHSSDPNSILRVEFENESDKMNLSLIAIRDISSGEEITYNYSLSGHQGKLQTCTCGNPECNGSFHLRQEFGEFH